MAPFIWEQLNSNQSHLPSALSSPRETSGSYFSQTSGTPSRNCNCVCIFDTFNPSSAPGVMAFFNIKLQVFWLFPLFESSSTLSSLQGPPARRTPRHSVSLSGNSEGPRTFQWNIPLSLQLLGTDSSSVYQKQQPPQTSLPLIRTKCSRKNILMREQAHFHSFFFFQRAAFLPLKQNQEAKTFGTYCL